MKHIIIYVLSFLIAIPSFSQTLVKEVQTKVKHFTKMHGIYGENGTFCLSYRENGIDHYKIYDKDFNQINTFSKMGLTDANSDYPRIHVSEEGFTFYYNKEERSQVSVLFLSNKEEKYNYQTYSFFSLKTKYLGLIADKGVYYALSLDKVKDIINVHRLYNNGEKEEKKFDINALISYKIDISGLITAVFSSDETPNFAAAGAKIKAYLLDKTKILITYDGGVNLGITRTFVLDWETGGMKKGQTIGTLENKAKSNSFYLDGTIYQYKSNKNVFSLVVHDLDKDKPNQVFTYKTGDKMEACKNNKLYRLNNRQEEQGYERFLDTKTLLKDLHQPDQLKVITAQKQNDGTIYLRMGNSYVNGSPPPPQFRTLSEQFSGEKLVGSTYITSVLTADKSTFLDLNPPKEPKINSKTYMMAWNEEGVIKMLSNENRNKTTYFIKEKETALGKEIKSHIIVPYGDNQLLLSYLDPTIKKIMFYLMN